MNSAIVRAAHQHRWVWVTAALLTLLALWWLFRPEKLWVTERVDEPAPYAAHSGPQAVYTARLKPEMANVQGRATVYRGSDGSMFLRLTDLSATSKNLQLALLKQGDKALQSKMLAAKSELIELGPLKNSGEAGDYPLSASTDLKAYNTVAIYQSESRALAAVALLEPF